MVGWEASSYRSYPNPPRWVCEREAVFIVLTGLSPLQAIYTMSQILDGVEDVLMNKGIT